MSIWIARPCGSHDLEKIDKLLDFNLKVGLFDEGHPYNYLKLNTGVIFALKRDYYLINLGNTNKIKCYVCRYLPNLINFIETKLIIK